jgi:hypothetical protein
MTRPFLRSLRGKGLVGLCANELAYRERHGSFAFAPEAATEAWKA